MSRTGRDTGAEQRKHGGPRLCSAAVDSEDRRARILRAAAALFIQHGYAGVSMDDVLAAVGGSKSTLYRYFADKVDLFRSSVEMMIDERSRPLKTFRPGDSDIAATLREFGHYFATIVLEPEAIALHRLVTSEAERVEGIGKTFFEHGPATGQAIMGSYLRDQRDAGVIDLPDPLLASAQLYEAMLGDLQRRLLVNAHRGRHRSHAGHIRHLLSRAPATPPGRARARGPTHAHRGHRRPDRTPPGLRARGRSVACQQAHQRGVRQLVLGAAGDDASAVEEQHLPLP